MFLIDLRGLASLKDQRFVIYRFLPLLTLFGHFWPLLTLFLAILSTSGYLIGMNFIIIDRNMMILTWMGLPTLYDKRFVIYWFWPLLTPFLATFDHFWAILSTSGQLRDKIIWNTNRNTMFPLTMRGLPSLKDQRFMRYEIWSFWRNLEK